MISKVVALGPYVLVAFLLERNTNKSKQFIGKLTQLKEGKLFANFLKLAFTKKLLTTYTNIRQ